ncbi:ArsR/SmtB family transcription factor [Demequina sp.]|uniref:ArsR/SmtB family transcription factor n=1 Tax=Demequina sp. TaxID=2050685 RepID=UPI003D128422
MTTLEVLGRSACCTPVTADAMSRADAQAVAHALKALAEPARVQIISLVAASSDAEACVCDLQDALGLSQGTVSHHLKVLVDAGFLQRSKRGTWAYYRLIPGALESVAAALTAPRR